ncbi:MAG: arsenosugar biosynthesis radical SAM (seleno)protein ArsS [Planctomycetaceae bacterium]
MPLPTLWRSQHPLAEPAQQVALLEQPGGLPRFGQTLAANQLPPLARGALRVLQLNLGKVCNLTCRHCHVDAGPERKESMSRTVVEQCVELARRAAVPTVDITGGAPEMHPDFRWLVEELTAQGRRVIDRSNLTILLAPGFTDLPPFLARHRVEIVASLPCYLEQNVDKQRGDGVFDASVEALRRLNAEGYGVEGSGREVHLIFNPLGPSLPPAQPKLEADYRRELRARYGLEFNRLYVLANQPISRFLHDLVDTGRLDEYLEKLVNAFNPHTVEGLMCRSTLSVDWRGRLYDCDFNQMLDLPLHTTGPATVGDALDNLDQTNDLPITTGRHCYACTAGAGSSCQGAVVEG